MKLVVEKKIKGFGKGIDGFILFMEWYETQSNRTVDGQDYIGLALQEIYPQAKIYDMNKLNLVPTKLYVKFNISPSFFILYRYILIFYHTKSEGWG